MCELPASIAFSTSSFTTEAGRCTTSPAAIWLASASGSRRMIFCVDISFAVSCAVWMPVVSYIH
jgi:hypothetical protein